jgi:hypothetical protein
MFTHLVPADTTTHVDIIWNKIVPLKMSLFAWRMLQDRLSTKDNLVRRDVTLETGVLCSGGCGMDEDVDHLILGCTGGVQRFWSKIVTWLGVCGPLRNVVSEHATQFCNFFRFG